MTKCNEYKESRKLIMGKLFNIFNKHVKSKDKKKKYNSAGLEIKMAILPGMVGGYMCPTCGYRPCYLSHCMRCGQPLVYDECGLDEYEEMYANIDQECIMLDQRNKDWIQNGIPIPTVDLDGNPIPTLCEKRAEILLEMKNEKK